MLTRGIKHNIDRFITELQGNYFPLKTDKGNYVVQLAVRPIQLWEVVMPEPCLNEVIKMIWNEEPKFNFKENLQLNSLRKLLGAKKLPKFDYSKVPTRPIFHQDMGLYPVGIKPDNYDKTGEHEGQEFL